MALTAIDLSPKSLPLGVAAATRSERLAFWFCVLAAGSLMWLAPRPPQIDLPQHAAQIALWRDLLKGASPWSRLVSINLLTPYLIGYASALPLSFVMSVEASVAVVLTLSFYAFAAACVALRKEMGADARLDWLFLPSFFGFDWKWGFYTYLTAAPVLLLFLLVVLRYRRESSPRRGALVVGAGLGLLFSHGLLFLFGLFAGGLLLLGPLREPFAPRLRRLAPMIVLALVLAVFAWTTHERGTAVRFGAVSFGEPLWLRPFGALTYISGTNWDLDPILATLGGLALATPFFIGSRLNRGAPQILFAALAFVFLFVPSYAYGTNYLFARFAVFGPPFFVFLFREGAPAPGSEGGERVARAVLALICVSILCVQGWRVRAFASESASFARVERAAAPDRRALALIFDPSSPAADARFAYVHFPAWYQADRGGFVDFNFASFQPQVVRFRPGRAPAIDEEFVGRFSQFDWRKDQGWLYDYFFIRGGRDRAHWLQARSPCALSLVAADGPWLLMRRDSCPAGAAGAAPR